MSPFLEGTLDDDDDDDEEDERKLLRLDSRGTGGKIFFISVSEDAAGLASSAGVSEINWKG